MARAPNFTLTDQTGHQVSLEPVPRQGRDARVRRRRVPDDLPADDAGDARRQGGARQGRQVRCSCSASTPTGSRPRSRTCSTTRELHGLTGPLAVPDRLRCRSSSASGRPTGSTRRPMSPRTSNRDRPRRRDVPDRPAGPAARSVHDLPLVRIDPSVRAAAGTGRLAPAAGPPGCRAVTTPTPRCPGSGRRRRRRCRSSAAAAVHARSGQAAPVPVLRDLGPRTTRIAAELDELNAYAARREGATAAGADRDRRGQRRAVAAGPARVRRDAQASRWPIRSRSTRRHASPTATGWRASRGSCSPTPPARSSGSRRSTRRAGPRRRPARAGGEGFARLAGVWLGDAASVNAIAGRIAGAAGRAAQPGFDRPCRGRERLSTRGSSHCTGIRSCSTSGRPGADPARRSSDCSQRRRPSTASGRVPRRRQR